ncbi:MAG TPA: S8 family peptidase, partial [Candidatus Sulfotelmatobacter sp.]
MKHIWMGKPKRGERGSAAWGKRLAAVAILLVADISFAQNWVGLRAPISPRFTPELNEQLSRARQGAGGSINVRVIVQYKQAPPTATLARVQNIGGRIAAKLDLVKGAAFSVPVNALAALENDPEVEYVSVDHTVSGLDDYTDTAINTQQVWTAGYDGTGIGVAVIDSGINDTHSDLWSSTKNSRVVYHQDFTGTSIYSGNKLIYDLYGHGTHVAGIIGGNGNKSNGRYVGVAPNVNLIDLRVLDAFGAGSDSNVIAAIQKAIALKNTYNIRVINLSLGRGIAVRYAKDPLCQAVESAWKAGIVVVAAAGNFGRISVNDSQGYGTVAAPGNDPLILTVGAMKSMNTFSRSDDQIASYSSKGPTTYDHVVKPDLVAPGNVVVSLDSHGSTLESEYPHNEVSGNSTLHDYFILSGTSMATPATAAAV